MLDCSVPIYLHPVYLHDCFLVSMKIHNFIIYNIKKGLCVLSCYQLTSQTMRLNYLFLCQKLLSFWQCYLVEHAMDTSVEHYFINNASFFLLWSCPRPYCVFFFLIKKKNKKENNRKEKSYKLHIQPVGLKPITLPSIPFLR